MILLGIIFDFVPFWGEMFAIGFVVLLFYACSHPNAGKEECSFHIEETEHPESPESAYRYAGMTGKELRQQAEEAERKMKQMR